MKKAPALRIDGRTSDVTHFLDDFAAGNLLLNIKLWRPDSAPLVQHDQR